MIKKEKNSTKLINIVKLVICTILILIISIFIRKTKITSVEELKLVISNAGDIGVLTYIGLFSILPTFFVPVTILAMAGGLAFGLVRASIYTFIASFINCTITYFVGKYIAYDLVNDLIRDKYKGIYEKLKIKSKGKEGFIFMAILRLLPLIPFTFLNYISGVVGYDYLIFITSSLVGIIPGIFAYVNIGSNLDSIGSKGFYKSRR